MYFIKYIQIKFKICIVNLTMIICVQDLLLKGSGNLIVEDEGKVVRVVVVESESSS